MFRAFAFLLCFSYASPLTIAYGTSRECNARFHVPTLLQLHMEPLVSAMRGFIMRIPLILIYLLSVYKYTLYLINVNIKFLLGLRSGNLKALNLARDPLRHFAPIRILHTHFCKALFLLRRLRLSKICRGVRSEAPY